MELDLVNLSTDFKTVNKWRVKRGLTQVSLSEMPSVGIIAKESYKAIAMGFIRQCEGRVGILDSIITDPDATSELRHEALDQIFNQVQELAKAMGLLMLMGTSVDAGTIERSKKVGFVESEAKLMVLKIEG